MLPSDGKVVPGNEKALRTVSANLNKFAADFYTVIEHIIIAVV